MADRGPAPVVAVVGATATGKSAVAIALAQELGGEIINADSMQFYRGMDIGTAKVPVEDRGGIPHHQLDTLDVTQDASVAHYQEAARADIDAIRARGARPVLVGGSGLYIRAALDQFEFPGTDPELRAELEARVAREGPGILHRELAQRDPQAAAAIDPRNAKRIVRALEVIALTGEPYGAGMPAHTYAIDAVQIGLRLPYEHLDARIEARVMGMWELGLVDEVRRLDAAGIRDGVTARRAVGYAETLRHLDGEMDEATTRDLIAQHTRRLARRQHTWFKPDPRIQWIDAPADGTDVRRAVRDALGTLGA